MDLMGTKTRKTGKNATSLRPPQPVAHLAISDPENKSLNFFSLLNMQSPKSLKFSHWPSEVVYPTICLMFITFFLHKNMEL